MQQKIDFPALEKKWRPYWAAIDLYKTGADTHKPKAYVLDFFPYPSGDGLSVGHCRNYVPTCIYTRYLRMQGVNVLHPMGWDAFGLPAERAAVRENIHPSIITKRNVDNFRRQIKRLGFSYDWEIGRAHV